LIILQRTKAIKLAFKWSRFDFRSALYAKDDPRTIVAA